MTDIYDFIKELKLNKVITIKQIPFIENVFFYIDDLVIYKYVIAVRPSMFKRAQRFGLNKLYDIHDNVNVKIKEPLANTSQGRYILLWNPGSNDIVIAEGEDTFPKILK